MIGLVGGIAAGKSTVAAMFAELGAAVIDADAIARKVLNSQTVCQKLRRTWGERVFDSNGLPDRQKIAEMVFADDTKRRQLNRWVHPPTLKAMRAQLKRALQNPRVSCIIIDAPLLIEADLHSWCDAIIFVEAALAQRLERARLVRGWPDEEVRRRESAQVSLASKRKQADAVINNNGSREATRLQVQRLFRRWICNSSSPRKSSQRTSGGSNNGKKIRTSKQ